MIQINKPEECCGCTACLQICPRKCIEMREDAEGFLYPFVDKEQCINCDLCNDVCPVINSFEFHPVKEAYAAYVIDNEMRLSSSSGGIFGVIAEAVIKRKGIVCAVRMSEDCKEAVFDIVSDSKSLISLQGSKYLQAYPDQVFLELKSELDKRTTVFFSGTPCQVNGFKLFLGDEYDNLITMDIICHGVPVPFLWGKYIGHLEGIYNSVVINVNFRDKSHGWRNFGLLSRFKNNKTHYSEFSMDPYMGMFLRNLCLRPSCYECGSKKYRMADITVGDFWGIDNVFIDPNVNLGVSSVIVRNDKGKEIFDEISAGIVKTPVIYEDIIKENSPEYMSVNRPLLREEFIRDIHSLDIKAVIKKYCMNSRAEVLITKVKNKTEKFFKQAMVIGRVQSVYSRLYTGKWNPILFALLRVAIGFWGTLLGSTGIVVGLISRKSNIKAKYKLVIVAIAKNESEYIREWVAFHKIIGVDAIYLYDNDSTDDMKECIRDYIDEGFVIYNEIHGVQKQYDAYNDALSRYGKYCGYMAFIDCDEFLVPKEKYGDIVEEIDKVIKQHKNAGGVAINWCMYGSSGYIDKPEGLCIENFVMRADTETGNGNDCVKSIVIPKCVKRISNPHYPKYRFGFCSIDFDGNPVADFSNKIVDYGPIRINHYFTKSREQWIKRRSMGRADIAGYRTMEDFDQHDNNDLKDLSAAVYAEEVKNEMDRTC